MEITRQPIGETLLLTLRGRLDGVWSEHTGNALEQAVEEGWHRLDLDLSGVTFLSSAGIRVLVIHYKQLHKINGRLAIVQAAPEIRQILEMAGLKMLLGEPSPAGSPVSDLVPAGGLGHPTLQGEVHPLQPGAVLKVRRLTGEEVRFPETAFGVGLGCLGRNGPCGEFLALGGAILTQPPDDQQTTDYLLSQGDLVPEVTARSGLIAEGAFSELLRFDARETAEGSTPLGALLELILARVGEAPAAGFVLAAECASLVGAALTAPPGPDGVRFDFPEIRNHLLFTAEPAWPQSMVFAAGFVSRDPEGPWGAELRPVAPGPSPLHAHVHAVAFPFRPLPKGKLDLPATVRTVLEEERALGILHLIHDWRPIGGAGESRFNRGALWFAPLQPA